MVNTSAEPLEVATRESDAAPCVLCVAGSGELDRIAALYLVDLLRRDGHAPRVLQLDRGIATRGGFEFAVDIVCLSYMKANSTAQARHLVRRLRRGLPGATIVAGFWSEANSMGRGKARDMLAATEADAVAELFREAVEEINKAAAAVGFAAAKGPLPSDQPLEMLPLLAGHHE